MSLAVRNVTAHTVTRGVIRGATVLVKDGKIYKAGRAVKAPSGWREIDGRGANLYPGLIDAHTHLGLYEEGIGREGHDGNEKTNPITPHLRAIDGINPFEPGFYEACANGITTVSVMPASSNLIGGQALIMKTHGKDLKRRILKEPSGIKMALGENPKRAYRERDESPQTRMGSAALIRDALTRARSYLDKMREGDGERDLVMEPLAALLKGELPALVHAHRADDIMTAVRLSEEFGFRLILEHGTEAHKVADELAERRIPVVVGPVLTARQKVELRDRTPATASILHEKGVLFALTSDHPVTPAYSVVIGACCSIREGLGREEALRALTINPAVILGMEHRIGSIEEGKDADLIVVEGDLFDPRHRVSYTIVDGEIAHSLSPGTFPVI